MLRFVHNLGSSFFIECFCYHVIIFVDPNDTGYSILNNDVDRIQTSCIKYRESSIETKHTHSAPM